VGELDSLLACGVAEMEDVVNWQEPGAGVKDEGGRGVQEIGTSFPVPHPTSERRASGKFPATYELIIATAINIVCERSDRSYIHGVL